MIYLITQLWLWMVVAFVVGAVLGWRAHAPTER